ncbi:hypothetical protein [Photobacterium damselae]|uniref:hypothetical protein n=1 Tax=Photobacterium damselae TaxID=38293 RepID=UPI001F29395A|nr:hypothetical protein [Photobacterium damselae]MCG3844703.1 hypothetical protein [Photobacterium damselae]UKA11165.1 hypothetical protein IHC91_05705 [Photobacterium damselae subsp. damselae]
MRFSKTLLAVLIPTTLALTGCGGDSSDSNNNGGSVTPPTPEGKVTATFVDKEVAGLQYKCTSGETGTTGSKGEFVVTKNTRCTFSVNNLELGSTIVSEKNQKAITPYDIAKNDNVKNIAALLQTLDSDSNPENGISLTDLDSELVLPSTLLTTTDEKAFQQTLSQLLPNKKIVSFDDAHKHLQNTLSDMGELRGYHSQAVEQVITDINNNVLTNLTKTNFQAKLAEYKKLLDEGEKDNADVATLQAVITVAEILNKPEVKERFSFQYPENGNPFDYTELLPKAIDAAVNDAAELLVNDEITGSTDNEAETLYNFAQELVKASDMLGLSFTSTDRIAQYDQAGTLTLNYQEAQSLRAIALTAANLLSTAAAYQLGTDDQYLPKTANDLNLKVVKETCDWNNVDQPCNKVSTTLPVETVDYENASIDPAALVKNPNFLALRTDPKYMELALEAISEAANIGATKVDLSQFDYPTPEDEQKAKELVNNLNQHFQAPADKPVLVNYSDEEMKLQLNLRAFFNVNTGLSHEDITVIENKYSCTLDQDMTKVMNEPMCHEANYMGDWLSYGPTQNISYFIEGYPAKHILDIDYNSAKLDVIMPKCELKDDQSIWVQCQ